MSVEPEVVWNVGAALGEGPAWFAGEAALRFVDIRQGMLHRYSPADRKTETIELGGSPSFVVPEQGGSLLVGNGNAIQRLDGGTKGETVALIDQPPRNRTNDATVDEEGRLWFGTMDDEESAPTGRLWCLDNGQLHCMGGDAVVTNGPAVTADGTTLYHVDSGARTIWRFSLGQGRRIARREVFLQLSHADGHPDGVVLDSEECLWVALWDGWAVRRYGPDGSLLMEIVFPCARITKLAFGGADLKTAFVTSARAGLSPEALSSQPHAGALFAFAAPVAGRTLPAVRWL